MGWGVEIAGGQVAEKIFQASSTALAVKLQPFTPIADKQDLCGRMSLGGSYFCARFSLKKARVHWAWGRKVG